MAKKPLWEKGSCLDLLWRTRLVEEDVCDSCLYIRGLTPGYIKKHNVQYTGICTRLETSSNSNETDRLVRLRRYR